MPDISVQSTCKKTAVNQMLTAVFAICGDSWYRPYFTSLKFKNDEY